MTSPSATARLDWVDASKAFAIILVVLLHTRIELGYIGISATWVQGVLDAFYYTPMPLFFALSGIFAGKWLAAPWRPILSKKVAPLLWVFIIWQPIVFLYKTIETLALPNQPDNTVISQLGKFAVTLVRPNGELWFLWALCVFFILAKLISPLPRWAQLAIAVTMSLVWSNVLAVVLPDSVIRVVGNGWTGIFLYFVFFLAAAHFAGPITRLVTSAPLWSVILFVVVSVAVTVTVGATGLRLPALSLVLQTISVLAGFGIGRLLGFAGRPVAAIGRGTLQIYLAHTFYLVLFAVALYYSPLLETARDAPELTALAAVLFAVAAAWYTHALLSRGRVTKYMYETPARFTLAPSPAVRRPG